MIAKIAEKYRNHAYFLFRVLAGLLFLQHGLQKMFGLLGGKQITEINLFYFAGIFEIVIPVLLILGLFTRLAALAGIGEMTVAWFTSHAPLGWIPIMNGGELALLYWIDFLILLSFGSGKWALDNKIFKKK